MELPQLKRVLLVNLQLLELLRVALLSLQNTRIQEIMSIHLNSAVLDNIIMVEAVLLALQVRAAKIHWLIQVIVLLTLTVNQDTTIVLSALLVMTVLIEELL